MDLNTFPTTIVDSENPDLLGYFSLDWHLPSLRSIIVHEGIRYMVDQIVTDYDKCTHTILVSRLKAIL